MKRLYSWYVTLVLLFAYAVSYVDRQVISLMVDPIKRDLGLSDVQISVLQGFAFAIFYTALGLVLGRIADRQNRRNLILLGIVIWSVATAGGGLAVGFASLFAARLFVGVGEASLSPSAYSMLADYFPPAKRALPVSVYSLGVFLGTGAAFLVGGHLTKSIASSDNWQRVFFMVAIPGAVAAVLMLTVREPARTEHVEVSSDTSFIRTHIKTYRPLILGYSVISVVTLSLFAWLPATLIRVFTYTPGAAGELLGFEVLIFGLIGMITAGFAGDRLARRRRDGAFVVSLIGSFALLPCVAAFALWPTLRGFIWSTSALFFFLGFPVALAPAAYQEITPNRLRGQVIALYLLANNLIGLSLGPTLVAALNDYAFHDPRRVGLSLALVCAVASALGVALLWRARAGYAVMIAPSRSSTGHGVKL